MEEEYSVNDPTQLLAAASDFAQYPGVQSDAFTKEFLDRFPLPVIISALQTKGDVTGLENALVSCLEGIFRTKYGASLIPHYMPFVVAGLGADSQRVRCVACKTVSYLLKNSDETTISPARLVIDYDVYPLLLRCLIDGDEQVSTVSMDAIRNLAGSLGGLAIVFPANINDATHLRNLAAGCSSLLAEIQHSTEFLSRTTLLQLLASVISNASIGSILRARAMMIIGRLMSREYAFMFIDESNVKTVISAIDGRLGLECQDEDEFECAVEALGHIGMTIQGAVLLLSSSPPAARHVVAAAFDQHGRGKQLAALHALGNIAGETRLESNRMLNVDTEESLRLLIYETASKSSKLTPSGLFLSALQQELETRLAGYRLLTGLVARPWCLPEICSRQEIINIVTDTFTETTKIGMEARHNCCQAISKALMLSSKLTSDPALGGIALKLEEAVRRGPYLARKHSEVQPAVMTAERF
ncbi:uncharacterized protein LOC130751874 isoform X4 [Actinidia eriantha]|uniref:uncharacterized protein LOC130751874 isoform X4 n=1 Tax=Actinidia eriantha TaxID=165200 RepID=UPI002583F9F4|nr:uncharacterized protein LOC130751874 isoform X4 [Actinidia eriantha]